MESNIMNLYYNAKWLNISIIFIATLLVAKFILSLRSRFNRRLPLVVKAPIPIISGLLRFLKGPIVLLREEYPKLGSVFTLILVNKKMTFLIGPEVSSHFFKAVETDLSHQRLGGQLDEYTAEEVLRERLRSRF